MVRDLRNRDDLLRWMLNAKERIISSAWECKQATLPVFLTGFALIFSHSLGSWYSLLSLSKGTGSAIFFRITHPLSLHLTLCAQCVVSGFLYCILLHFPPKTLLGLPISTRDFRFWGNRKTFKMGFGQKTSKENTSKVQINQGRCMVYSLFREKWWKFWVPRICL